MFVQSSQCELKSRKATETEGIKGSGSALSKAGSKHQSGKTKRHERGTGTIIGVVRKKKGKPQQKGTAVDENETMANN